LTLSSLESVPAMCQQLFQLFG